MTRHKNEIYDHVERPARIQSIHKFNLLRGIFGKYRWVEIQKCEPDFLKLLHSQKYLDRQKNILEKITRYYQAKQKSDFLEEKEKKKDSKDKKDEMDDLTSLMKDLKVSSKNDTELTEEEKQLIKKFPEDIHINFGDDNFENQFTFEAALLSASSIKTSLDLMFPASKDPKAFPLNKVFCNIRPPGHHSLGNSKCEASGFCFFNNVALGAKYAIEKLGLKRVAIVDWDVHHGDGTQRAFADDPRVLFISLHRYEDGMFYPGKSGAKENTGKGKGKGFNVNIEWNTQAGFGENSSLGDHEYIFMFENVIRPMLQEFKPELILVSSGFDSAHKDPLGGIANTPDTYGYFTHNLKKLCPKILIALEGGYNLFALSVSSEAVLRSLVEDGFSDLSRNADEYFDALMDKYSKRPVKNVHGK